MPLIRSMRSANAGSLPDTSVVHIHRPDLVVPPQMTLYTPPRTTAPPLYYPNSFPTSTSPPSLTPSPASTSSIATPRLISDSPSPVRLPDSAGPRRRTEHIKRPKNAFILFRSHFVRKLKETPETYGKENHREISKAAGQAWHALPDNEKAVWYGLADREARQFKIDHPDYKYDPVFRGARAKKQPGTSSPHDAPIPRCAPRRPRKVRSDEVPLLTTPLSSTRTMTDSFARAGDTPSCLSLSLPWSSQRADSSVSPVSMHATPSPDVSAFGGTAEEMMVDMEALEKRSMSDLSDDYEESFTFPSPA